MANQEHFEKLMQSINEHNCCFRWNQWREENSFIEIDLSNADLAKANLDSVDLSGADLLGANLAEACLFGANLKGACLHNADLTGASLRKANLCDSELTGSKLLQTQFYGAALDRVNLSGALIKGADIYEKKIRVSSPDIRCSYLELGKVSGEKIAVFDTEERVNELIDYMEDTNKCLEDLCKQSREDSQELLSNKIFPGFIYVGQREYTCGGKSNDINQYLHIGTGLDFVLVPTGIFRMGTPMLPNETPVHRVSIRAFLMAQYPVTQKIWRRVMSTRPSYFKGLNQPVERVSWHDCREFCVKSGLELPSEAQWEYACRGGSTTRYFWGDDITDKHCWYDDDLDAPTHAVMQKEPNSFGLYDMSGNVWEWCEDTWHENYEGAPTDGRAWVEDDVNLRVLRGGCCWNSAFVCRSSNRYKEEADHASGEIGFRVIAPIA